MKIALGHRMHTATQFYRLFLPASQLLKTGDIEYISRPIEFDSLGLLADPLDFDADVFIVSMPTIPGYTEAIRRMKNKGIRVIVDIDDYLPGIVKGHRTFHTVKSRHPVLKQCVRLADVVTCSTEFISSKYDGVTLKNYIPSQYLEAARLEKRREILWYGSLDIHVDDFEVAREGVQRVLNDFPDVSFRHIGKGELKMDGPVIETGHMTFEKCLSSIMNSQIGIVPLADIGFNEAKSWLKGLEMSAMGTPFVASALPDYIDLNKHGAGILASTPQEWYDGLASMLADDEYFKECRNASFETAKSLTIESNAEKYLEVWTNAASK